MKNEAVTVRVAPGVYRALAKRLLQDADQRSPDEIVSVAIRAWLANSGASVDHGGYQWKDLFLPNGTELRLRFQGDNYYARIAEGQLMYADEPMSPRAWLLLVTGTVRNAWRDIWIRRHVHELWARASVWRPDGKRQLCYPYLDRRQHHRRRDD